MFATVETLNFIYLSLSKYIYMYQRLFCAVWFFIFHLSKRKFIIELFWYVKNTNYHTAQKSRWDMYIYMGNKLSLIFGKIWQFCDLISYYRECNCGKYGNSVIWLVLTWSATIAIVTILWFDHTEMLVSWPCLHCWNIKLYLFVIIQVHIHVPAAFLRCMILYFSPIKT